MASHRAYQLSDAIADMVLRYGEATRAAATAHAEAVEYYGQQRAWSASREQDRWDRASERRFRAIQRLTAALRDLPMKEER